MTVHSQTDLFDSGVGEYILAPRGVILGAHTDGEKQRYTGVRLRTRDLDEWAAVGGFSSTSSDDGTRAIHFLVPEFESATLASGGTFTVSQTAVMRGPNVRGGSIEREVWLKVTGLQPSTWQEIDRQIVTPLSTLITLCVGEVNDISAIELTVDGESWVTLGASYIRHAEVRTERGLFTGLIVSRALIFDRHPHVSGGPLAGRTGLPHSIRPVTDCLACIIPLDFRARASRTSVPSFTLKHTIAHGRGRRFSVCSSRSLSR